MMEYKTVALFGQLEWKELPGNLDRAVNREIKQGWKPQGGVSSVHFTAAGVPSVLIMSQAMVKE